MRTFTSGGKKKKKSCFDTMANELQQETFSEYSTNKNGGREGTSQYQDKQVSARELLNNGTNTLIEEINAKRKRDQELLSDFKKAIDQHCSNAYNSIEMAMYNSYERTQSAMEEKLQELFAVLDRIEKLEVELAEFKTALSALYSDVHGSDVA